MTEIKTWGDRLAEIPDGTITTSYHVTGAMQDEIAELRARLSQQAEMVEKCMVAMNENADRGMKAEQERDELRARVAELESGKPVAWINKDHTYVQLSDKSTVYGSHTIPLFTHPARPMSETTAWLIELNIANAPCWLTGTGAYTNDANEALQFVREIDAKAMLDVYMGAKFGKEIIGIYRRHFAPENYRVTEHIFHGIKGVTE